MHTAGAPTVNHELFKRRSTRVRKGLVTTLHCHVQRGRARRLPVPDTFKSSASQKGGEWIGYLMISRAKHPQQYDTTCIEHHGAQMLEDDGSCAVACASMSRKWKEDEESLIARGEPESPTQ